MKTEWALLKSEKEFAAWAYSVDAGEIVGDPTLEPESYPCLASMHWLRRYGEQYADPAYVHVEDARRLVEVDDEATLHAIRNAARDAAMGRKG